MDDRWRDDPLLERLPRVETYPLLPPCLLYGFIGRGGMGTVFLARHLRLGVDVAVKCMRPDIASRDQSWVLRFQREAGFAALINHQNLVRAYDVLCWEGLNYIVMEAVRGQNLRQYVERRGALPTTQAATLLARAAAGLAAAHAAGIVHRDIKPDNLLLSLQGDVKVADLGLARAFEAISNEELVTLQTTLMGTPHYMAPEQWEDTHNVGPAADVYALGATLWFMLAGSDARGKGGLLELRRRALRGCLPDIRNVRDDVPAALADLIARSTDLDPEARFPHASSLLASLVDTMGPSVVNQSVHIDMASWSPPTVRLKPDLLRMAQEAVTKLSSRPTSLTPASTDDSRGSLSDEASAQARALRHARGETDLVFTRWAVVAGVAVMAIMAFTAWLIMTTTTTPTPTTPNRIVMRGEAITTQHRLRDLLQDELDVAWDRIEVTRALDDIAARSQAPLKYRLEEYLHEMNYMGAPMPRVTFYGKASIETLLDVTCRADGTSQLRWTIGPRGVLVGSSDSIVSTVIGVYDIAQIKDIARLESLEIINLVRLNVAAEEWDAYDKFSIDLADDNRLLVVHEYLVQEEVAALLNGLLGLGLGLEFGAGEALSVLEERRAQMSTPVNWELHDGQSGQALIQAMASLVGLPLEISVEDSELEMLRTLISLRPEHDTVEAIIEAVRAQTGLHGRLLTNRMILGDNEAKVTEFSLVIYDASTINISPTSYVREDFNLLPSGTDVESSSDGSHETEPHPISTADILISLIEANIDPSTWNSSPEYQLLAASDYLIVRTTTDNHVRIRALIDQLSNRHADR